MSAQPQEKQKISLVDFLDLPQDLVDNLDSEIQFAYPDPITRTSQNKILEFVLQAESAHWSLAQINAGVHALLEELTDVPRTRAGSLVVHGFFAVDFEKIEDKTVLNLHHLMVIDSKAALREYVMGGKDAMLWHAYLHQLQQQYFTQREGEQPAHPAEVRVFTYLQIAPQVLLSMKPGTFLWEKFREFSQQTQNETVVYPLTYVAPTRAEDSFTDEAQAIVEAAFKDFASVIVLIGQEQMEELIAERLVA